MRVRRQVAGFALTTAALVLGSGPVGVVPETAMASPVAREARTPLVDSTLPWSQISAGANDSCGIRTDHTLWCWGANQYGEIGDGSLRQHTVPTPVNSAGPGWRSISAAGGYACGIRLDASLWCWGFNDHGQLGQGDKRTTHLPRPVEAGTTWLAVSGDAYTTCGLQTDHALVLGWQ